MTRSPTRARLDARVRTLRRTDPGFRPVAPERVERLLLGAPLDGLDHEAVCDAYVWARLEFIRVAEALRPLSSHWAEERAGIRAAILRRPARRLSRDSDRTTHEVFPRVKRTTSFGYKLRSLRERSRRLWRLKRRLAAELEAHDAARAAAEEAERAARAAEVLRIRAEQLNAFKHARRAQILGTVRPMRDPAAKASELRRLIRYERSLRSPDEPLLRVLNALLEKTLQRSRD